MKKVKLFLTMFISFAAMTDFAQSVDVYSVGQDGKLGKVWKNGEELYSVADETNSVKFDCIFVSGNDVYTGGEIHSDNYRGAIWKNGALLYRLTPSNANLSNYVDAVAVSNGNVYVCGSESTNAVFWKNGTKTILAQGYYNSYSFMYYYAIAMQVIGNDVYVAEYSSGEGWTYSSGRVWKNNEAQSVVLKAGFHDIAVSGSDIYIAGEQYDTNILKYKATVWKNGEELYSASDLDKFSAIAVSGSDVYVCGYTKNGYNSSKKFAKVWKNGEVFYQLSDGATDTRCDDIVVSGDDVFVLMRNFDLMRNIVLKNGVELYNFGSASVNAICLSSDVTGIKKIKEQYIRIFSSLANESVIVSGLQGNESLHFYNISGNLLFSRQATGETETIPVGHLPAGMYFVKTNNGQSLKWVKT